MWNLWMEQWKHEQIYTELSAIYQKCLVIIHYVLRVLKVGSHEA